MIRKWSLGRRGTNRLLKSREPCYGINGWSAAERPSFIREESKSKSCKCPYKTIEKVCPIKEGNPFRGHIAMLALDKL